MGYNYFTNYEDIPTIRRLDYIMKDMVGFNAG